MKNGKKSAARTGARQGRSSVQRAGRPLRRSREAMILDMLLLPLGLVRSLVMQGVPGTWDELRRLPKTYARGWRESFWFFWPTGQDHLSQPQK